MQTYFRALFHLLCQCRQVLQTSSWKHDYTVLTSSSDLVSFLSNQVGNICHEMSGSTYSFSLHVQWCTRAVCGRKQAAVSCTAWRVRKCCSTCSKVMVKVYWTNNWNGNGSLWVVFNGWLACLAGVESMDHGIGQHPVMSKVCQVAVTWALDLIVWLLENCQLSP